jgi:hypothetical protein
LKKLQAANEVFHAVMPYSILSTIQKLDMPISRQEGASLRLGLEWGLMSRL